MFNVPQHEVSLVLYPVFVHMYLELVYNGHEEVAKNFLERLKGTQEEFFQEDIHRLSLVTNREHMSGYQIMDNFRLYLPSCIMYGLNYTSVVLSTRGTLPKDGTLDQWFPKWAVSTPGGGGTFGKSWERGRGLIPSLPSDWHSLV